MGQILLPVTNSGDLEENKYVSTNDKKILLQTQLLHHTGSALPGIQRHSLLRVLVEKKRSGAWFWPCYRLAVWGKAYHLTTPLHKTSAQDVVSVHISSTQPPILIAVTLVFLPFHSDFCFSVNLCSSWLWFLQWWRRKLLSLHRAPLVINREPAQGAASCQSPGFSLNLKAFGVRAVILLFVCSKKLDRALGSVALWTLRRTPGIEEKQPLTRGN